MSSESGMMVEAPPTQEPTPVKPTPQEPTPVKPTPASPPPLECLDRVVKLPIVEAAIAQSTGFYERVKGLNGLVYWTLSTAEGTAKVALNIASPFAIPFILPIYVVDRTLCKGLDIVESRLPIIKEQPQEIFDVAKNYGTDKVRSLAELSKQKANEVLTTRLVGKLAYTGFDSTALLAERYFDYYFPPIETEQQEPVAEEDPNDRVSHTINTVSRISHKMAHRVYVSVSAQLKSIDIALDAYFDALKHATNTSSAKEGTSQQSAGTTQQSAPVEGTTQQSAPVDGTTQQSAPVEGTTQQSAPVEGTTQQSAPVEGTTQQATSADAKQS